MKQYILTAILAMMLTACGSETAAPENKQSEATQAEPTEQNIVNLGFTLDEFTKWVNDDLKAIESKSRMPENITLENKEGYQFKTAKIHLNDHLGMVVQTDKNNDKVTSITAMMAVSDNDIENISNGFDLAVVLSAANGEDGNELAGSSVAKMMGEALTEFKADPSKLVEKSTIKNGVQYQATLSQNLPLMFNASPVKTE